MTRRSVLRWGCLLLTLLPAAAPAVRGDEPASAASPLRYRRVLVPQELLTERTRGYLPIEREKFRALLADVAQQRQSAAQDATWVESAEYRAIFAEGQLVSGNALLRVRHTATEPAVLSLAPWGLAAGEGSWQGAETIETASLGTNAAGHLLVLVRHSGELQVPWTLRGTTNEWRESRFELSLAAAPLSRLVVDLPSDLQLWSDRGLLTPPADMAEIPPSASSVAPGLHRWVVELGGQTRCVLTVAARQMDRRRQRLVSVQQDTTYRLTDNALDIACDIGLEIHREPLAELRLEIAAEVQVTAVRLGNVDVDWHSVPSEDGRSQTVRVAFSERLTGVHSTLQLRAVGPLQTDSTWRLPAFRPQGVFWRQGTMTLVVPDTLVLRHLTAVDARQSASAAAPADERAELAAFEMFGMEGALELTVARRARGIVAEMGTTIDLGAGTVSALTLADLKSRFGERFVIEANVPNAWTIDGIDAEPAGSLHDYQVVAYEAEQRRLQIQLITPLTTSQSLRLKIRAHRTPSFPLTTGDVRPVEFVDATYAARLVAVAPDANYRLELEGDGALQRLDPQGHASGDAARLPARTGGVLFVDNARARPLRINISRLDPEFAAAVSVDAEVDPAACVESYRIRCTPDATPVTQLRVHLSEARAADLAWQFVGDGNAVLDARRVADEAVGTGLPRAGETWEIDLRRAQAAAFEIRGQRTTRATGPLTVALATLPAAVTHEGRLTIRSRDGTRLAVKASGVKSVPCEPPPPENCPTSRACYRFDASRNARVVIDRVPPRGDGATVWVWNCQLTSQYLAAGDVIHVATLLLESAGGAEIRVRLPDGCMLRGLEINGLEASRSLGANQDGFQTIALPDGQRFPRVELTYAQTGRPLGLWRRLQTEFPQVDVPVLHRSWRVWLPPGFRPAHLGYGESCGPDEPPSWKQRLLGPLAANAHAQPFRLLSREDWSGAPSAVDATHVAGSLEEGVLAPLGRILLATAADPRRVPLTWRELFEQYTDGTRSTSAAGAMWVDDGWLGTEGFSLDLTLPPWTGDEPVEAARSLLVAARLVIVAQGDVVFLTSRDGLARWAMQPSSDTSACTVVWEPQPAASIDLGRIRDVAVPGVVPLPTWVGTPAFPQAPWAGHRAAIRSGIAGRAWRVCELPGDDTGTCAITVERSAALAAVGWALLLAVAGVVACGGLRRGRFGYLWTVLAAVLALVVPAGWVPLTSSLLPGALLGLVIGGLRPRGALRCAGDNAGPAEGLVARAQVITTALLILLLVLLQVSGVGAWQPQVESPPTTLDPVYSVVVPVDATLTPVGQYDYLPAEFYDALHLRASRQGMADDAWFLRQATYRAVFNWRQQHSVLDLTTMTAVYQLDVLRTHGRLEFPWNRQAGGAELLEARLDGQPIELNWNVARSVFSLPVPAAGTYQLELVLRPDTREEPGERSLRLAVPAVARARLSVEVPFGAPDVRATSALGSSYIDPESGTQHTELGPIRELLLRWPSSSAASSTPEQMDVQQLMWLRVQPKDQSDAVMLDTQLRVQAATRPIEEIKLRVDSRLRLMPQSDVPEYEWSETPAAEPADNLVTLRLHTPVKNELTLRLRFHLTNTTGLGNVSLPRLEAVEGRTTRRWLAVSVSPDIEFTAAKSDLFAPLDAAEFLTLWGDAELAPNACYWVSAEDPGWSLSTRSRQPHSECRQWVDFSVGRGELQVALDAEIQTTNGAIYQHQLTVPKDFRVTSVVVTARDTDVANAVEHDGSGRVTVFLRRGVTDAHRLVVRGVQPLADSASSLPLPAVTLTDVTIRGHGVRIYRQSDMWVDVQVPSGVKSLGATPDRAFHETYGRLVTAFELSAEGLSSVAGVTMSFRPNSPRISARLVTTMRRADDQWEAIADLDARVAGESDGFVDQFRFEIPPEWTGPFSLEPSLPYEVVTIPGPRRHLIVRLWSPVTERFQLRIRGPLQLGANERGRTPNIVPLDTSSAERFFVLPTQLDEQRVDWETPGLVEVPLADVLPEGAGDATAVAYRVWSKPRAVIADVQRVAGQRRISLADVFVDYQAEGSCYGVVNFALEPAGIGHCTLEVPAGLDLVHAAVEGVPAALVPLADRRWQLFLASEQLPQQVTITFRGDLTPLGAERAQAMAVPWIADLSVARTLWTIRGPAGGRLLVDNEDVQPLSAAQQELLRLQTMAGLVSSAAETVLDSPARDMQAWYTPWAIRLACAGARIAYWQWQAAPGAGEADARSVATIYRQQEAIAQRLKASPTVQDFVAQTQRYAQTSDVWQMSGYPAAPTTHYDFSGPVRAVSLVWKDESPDVAWPNGWAVVLVILLGITLRALGKRGLLHAWCQRWPAAVGVLLGLTWWLVARPSLFGWVIVAVSLSGLILVPTALRDLPSNGLGGRGENTGERRE